MYAIRLELKTNWKIIFNNKCFFILFDLSSQPQFRIMLSRFLAKLEAQDGIVRTICMDGIAAKITEF